MPQKLLTADSIARANRSDLYLGVVAPVGIGLDSFRDSLERALSPIEYQLEVVRLSELLGDFRGIHVERSTEDARLRISMDAGSWLRKRCGADVLARQAMNEVHSRRHRTGRRPTAFVFWSLKHPEEVATLRHVYGGSFHLVALFATEEDRIAELALRSGVDDDAARRQVERDREEPGRDRGQRTRDTFHLADVFLEWKPLPDEAGLRRFVQILFGRRELTPTETEHRMFLAYVSALRSGELSRQVGAVLVSGDGDVLAVGANDVPRRGGGLHWPDGADDRDAVRGEDANTVVRGRLLTEVARSVAAEIGADETILARALEGSRLKEITEYGRAVHAEMEALLACARSGRSTRRTTLFVTTYPCHNCARHIIAAGVERVVFVEPYPKSRALELHDKDVLEVPPGGEGMGGRVRFEPYLGIGPRRFFDYFSMSLGSGYELRRKDGSGRLQPWDPATAAPRVQRPELPLPEQEKLMAAPLVDLRIDRT